MGGQKKEKQRKRERILLEHLCLWFVCENGALLTSNNISNFSDSVFSLSLFPSPPLEHLWDNFSLGQAQYTAPVPSHPSGNCAVQCGVWHQQPDALWDAGSACATKDPAGPALQCSEARGSAAHTAWPGLDSAGLRPRIYSSGRAGFECQCLGQLSEGWVEPWAHPVSSCPWQTKHEYPPLVNRLVRDWEGR